MTRGEIWWADFGVPVGSEPGFRRPVLIVQDDAFNDSRIDTVLIVPLTTNLFLESAPGNLLIEKRDCGLSKDSVLVVSQLTVLDKSRLVSRVQQVAQTTMERLEAGIRLILGLK